MKRPILVIALLLVGVVTASLWGATLFRGDSSALPPLHTATVDRGDVSQRVVAHGAVQPVQTVTVGSQVSGIVDQILVDFNSRVTRGQVVARIDPSTFAAAASSAQAELEASEAALELARMQWDRVETLSRSGVVAASEEDQSRAALRQAEAQVAVRRHALDRALRELDRATIYSPTDGIVISRNVDVGQTVAASLSAPVLFEIATDLSEMQIHAHVAEADIGVVQEGQVVRFRVDAHREREFTGQVVQVRNAPLVVDNVVHYETIIAVSNEEGLLKPGMTAEVNVVTDEVTDALRVRNTALRARLPDGLLPPGTDPEADRGNRVYLLRDGQILPVRVEVGLSDGLNTQILSGVEAGDVLVIGLSLAGPEEGERRSLFGGNQARF